MTCISTPSSSSAGAGAGAAGVTSVGAGDRCVFCMYACGSCFYCKQGNVPQCDSWVVAGFMSDGGLAEYMVFDEVGVVPVSEEEFL